MAPGLSITHREITPGLIIFTRSDGEMFELKRNDSKYDSLSNKSRPLDHGIDLHINITDKVAHAEKLILAYPEGWP
jgi:hypothetical protein